MHMKIGWFQVSSATPFSKFMTSRANPSSRVSKQRHVLGELYGSAGNFLRMLRCAVFNAFPRVGDAPSMNQVQVGVSGALLNR